MFFIPKMRQKVSRSKILLLKAHLNKTINKHKKTNNKQQTNKERNEMHLKIKPYQESLSLTLFPAHEI